MISQTQFSRVESYCIPIEAIVSVSHHECRYVGGGATIIVTTNDGETAWNGCGTYSCTQCKFCAADGAVGDDAIRKYRALWLGKIAKNEKIPAYVSKQLLVLFPDQYHL